MAVYRISELREMDEAELAKKMDELGVAMMEDPGNNPKKNREIRKAIARIKTILNERKKG